MEERRGRGSGISGEDKGAMGVDFQGAAGPSDPPIAARQPAGCDGVQPDETEASRRQVRASFMLVDVTTAALNEVAQRLTKKQLSIRIGSILPLAEARLAHEMLEGTVPRPPGKIVLSLEGAHQDS